MKKYTPGQEAPWNPSFFILFLPTVLSGLLDLEQQRDKVDSTRTTSQLSQRDVLNNKLSWIKGTVGVV